MRRDARLVLWLLGVALATAGCASQKSPEQSADQGAPPSMAGEPQPFPHLDGDGSQPPTKTEDKTPTQNADAPQGPAEPKAPAQKKAPPAQTKTPVTASAPRDTKAPTDLLSPAYDKAASIAHNPDTQASSLPTPPGRPVDAGAPQKCVPVPHVGCYLPQPGAKALLIYYRGFLTRRLPSGTATSKSNVRDDLLPESAADAVEQYQLRRVADGLNAALLVTGSSNVEADLSRLPAGAPKPEKVYVASHSGGYVGLSKSLPRLPKLAGIASLDDFYGAFGAITSQIKKRMQQDGTTCGGFYTDHNARRLKSRFTPAVGAGACPIEHSDSHNTGIADKLLKALQPQAKS